MTIKPGQIVFALGVLGIIAAGPGRALVAHWQSCERPYWAGDAFTDGGRTCRYAQECRPWTTQPRLACLNENGVWIRQD